MSETGEGSRFDVFGISNLEPRTSNFKLRIALFSHVSRFTRHGLWRMGKGASLGKEAVLADSGRAGEKTDYFSVLLERLGGIMEMGQRMTEGTTH